MPAAWTLVGDSQNTNLGGQYTALYYIPNSAPRGGNELILLSDSYASTAFLAEYSGLQINPLLDNDKSSGEGTPLQSASISTIANSPHLAVSFFGVRAVGTFGTPSNGFSRIREQTGSVPSGINESGVFNHKISSTNTSPYVHNQSHTAIPGVAWAGVIALFQGIAEPHPGCTFNGWGGPANPAYCNIPCQTWAIWINGVPYTTGDIGGQCCGTVATGWACEGNVCTNNGGPHASELACYDICDRMLIEHTWSPTNDPAACDYDSGVTWLGDTAGWQCAGGPYLLWNGDSTACGTGVESTWVKLKKARVAGAWTTNTTQIDIKGDWWPSRPGGFPGLQVDFNVVVKATWRGVTKQKTYNSPNAEQNCPVTTLGFIGVNWSAADFAFDSIPLALDEPMTNAADANRHHLNTIRAALPKKPIIFFN